MRTHLATAVARRIFGVLLPFWARLVDWLGQSLAADAMIAPVDVEHFATTDDGGGSSCSSSVAPAPGP